MPLALIGGVIAECRHAVANGLNRRRHVGLPKRTRIIKDAGMLDVLAGIDGRTRRRTNARRCLMIREGNAVLLDPFAAGNWDRPIVEEMLLIDQDEQDVVAAGRRVGRDDGGGLTEAYPVDSGLSRCSMLSDRIGAVARADTDGEGAVARGIPEVVSR